MIPESSQQRMPGIQPFRRRFSAYTLSLGPTCMFLTLGQVQTGENGMTAVGFKPLWGNDTWPSAKNLQSGLIIRWN